MRTVDHPFNPQIKNILDNIAQVIIGKEEVTMLSLVGLLAQGHVLIEDVPGVGKTMLVRTLAKSLDSEFKRIQFTPDLLPSDITGVSIYNPKTLSFEFRKGPIFGNIVLADEINRTSPKTQAALLEGMAERSVTVDGRTRSLAEPFFVMATQNPIDYAGTYPLPEAQVDRFMLKFAMGYPSREDERALLDQPGGSRQPIEGVEAVLTQADLLQMQEAVQDVYVADEVKDYIIDLVKMTRHHPHVQLGVSPRGSIALMKASQALAYIYDRDFVLPDDIKYLAPFVLAHRLRLSSDGIYKGITETQVITSILQEIDVPVRKVGF